MTYNIGQVKDSELKFDQVLEVIREINPDVLALQEITETVDLDGNWRRLPAILADKLGYGDSYYFGATISLREYFDARKDLFVDGIFAGWQDWWSGNAIYSRWPFLRLGQANKPGKPQNLPIYTPAIYEGSRDTDPRFILIAHIGCELVQPYAIAAHLTTLRGEYCFDEPPSHRISEKARALRSEQCQRMLNIIQKHLLEQNEVVFLLGDFNAIPTEPCMREDLESHGLFTRLLPRNPVPTHCEVPEPIDHILVHAGNKRAEYDCWIAEDPQVQQASDHLPVVADVVIYPETSPRTQAMGAGVYQLIEENR